jgi:hypothetical protein
MRAARLGDNSDSLMPEMDGSASPEICNGGSLVLTRRNAMQRRVLGARGARCSPGGGGRGTEKIPHPVN